jgi:molecular chaperone GrpE
MKTENEILKESTSGGSSAVPGAPPASTVASPGAAEPPSGSGDLPEDLAGAYRKAVAEKQEIYDRLARKQAEFENLRKRVEREKEEFLKLATADLIRSLLPALDSFERALKYRDPKVPPEFYKGVELIYKEFVEVLGRAGLDPLDAKGKIFDPHLHQAVERVESSQHRDQEIVEELQRGYKLKQRLLRPAVVKVAVSPRAPTREDREEKAQASS